MRSRSCFVRPLARFAALLALAPAAAIPNTFEPGEIKEVEQRTVPGTVIRDVPRQFRIDFGGGQFIAGILQDRIVDTDDGRRSFVSQLRNIRGSSGAVIESIWRRSFVRVDGPLDVTWSETSIDAIEPSFGLRSPNDRGTMAFHFSPGIAPSPGGIAGGSEPIAVHFDHTDVPQLSQGAMFIGARAASGAFSSTTLAVYAPIPEPATAVMFLAGLAVLGWIVRHRSHRGAAKL